MSESESVPAANAEAVSGDKKNEEQAPEKVEEIAVQSPKEMRAVVLSGFGGLKCVKILKKPEPTKPGEGEVLIRVKAW